MLIGIDCLQVPSCYDLNFETMPIVPGRIIIAVSLIISYIILMNYYFIFIEIPEQIKTMHLTIRNKTKCFKNMFPSFGKWRASKCRKKSYKRLKTLCYPSFGHFVFIRNIMTNLEIIKISSRNLFPTFFLLRFTSIG